MKSRLLPLLTLFALLLAACAPAATATDPQGAVTQPPAAVEPTATLPSSTLEVATQPAASEAGAVPLATSRGPDLHATDPSTVSLASGGLQFVEFFRFT